MREGSEKLGAVSEGKFGTDGRREGERRKRVRIRSQWQCSGRGREGGRACGWAWVLSKSARSCGGGPGTGEKGKMLPWADSLPLYAIEAADPEGLTENGFGSKRCEFQDSSKLLSGLERGGWVNLSQVRQCQK